MERALVLIASRVLTIDVARAGNALPRTFNHFSGRESKLQTGFNASSWGKATRSYTKSASGLKINKFNAIITEAQQFIKPSRIHNKATASEVIEIDDDDERALPPSDDDNCKLYYIFVTLLTCSLESGSAPSPVAELRDLMHSYVVNSGGTLYSFPLYHNAP